MAKYQKFELKITGNAIVRATSFGKADTALAKAMKAVCTRWDLDFYCKEVIPDPEIEKPYVMRMKGSVDIEGNSFEEAEELFYKALRSVSKRYFITIDQGEVTTIYDPPRRIGRGDKL
jgi:predicted Zn-dependent protease